MKRESESVSFIGLGYVGLCTAAVLASRGMKIIGVDIDGEKIAKLAKGETPLHEPRLTSMLKSAITNTLHPDKIVIGANDEKSGDKLVKLYQRIYRQGRFPL